MPARHFHSAPTGLSTGRHKPTRRSRRPSPTPSGVTVPRGFLAAGVAAGIKPPPKLDLALVVSEQEGPVAAVFTTNRLAAAPVILGRSQLRGRRGQVVFVNSGNANACTGAPGLAQARAMRRDAAGRLGIAAQTVFIGSTGVIGVPLPLARIRRALPALVKRLRRAGGREAARAIMTTDTTSKEVAVSARLGGRVVRIGGMAKGSGMIHPDLATMLAYLTTDAAIEQEALQRALAVAVDASFHRITVDGDSSPNDTVLCLANGRAGNRTIRTGSSSYRVFQRLLERACLALAQQIVHDGEGATKVVKVVVRGAGSPAEARRAAAVIATSSLVKTAWFGEDANWGRILAAVGRAGVRVHPGKVGLWFEGEPIVTRGVGRGAPAERRLSRIVKRKTFTVEVDLGVGRAASWLWTTDLSFDYVRINASYRT